MASRPPGASSKLSTTQTIVGIVSGVVGVVLAVVAAIDKHPPKEDKQRADRDRAADSIKFAQLSSDAKAREPRISVLYVTLTPAIVDSLQEQAGSRNDPVAAEIRFIRYPVVPTSVAGADLRARGAGLPSPIGGTRRAVICLVLENVGKSDAEDVEVQLDSLRLARAIKVERRGSLTPYDSLARAGATSSAHRLLQLPTALAPGAGVIIPLFVDIAPAGTRTTWYYGSPTVFLPRTIAYRKPDGQIEKINVRRMRDPLILGRIVESRG